MSFFLSSPPQPTYQKAHQHQQQNSFLTPQAHRTNLFPTIAWSSFQSKSPSPLRPSWNAGNVMKRHFDTKFDAGSENTQDEKQNVQFGEGVSNTPFSSDQAVFTSNSVSEAEHSASEKTSRNQFQNDAASSRNPFQFQSRARESAPGSQISTRIRNGRETRRGQFLDRIRSSRRDERDSRNIDKFERDEYWRERKEREQQMLREAEMVQLDIDGVDEDIMYGDVYEDTDDMSPIDEERELGALVEGWYEGMNQVQGQNDSSESQREEGHTEPEDDFMDGNFDFEDPDVEEVFMQVLSQQHPGNGSDPLPGQLRGENEGKDAEMS